MKLTAQVEPWHPTLEEMKPLLPAHYDELSLHKEYGFDLNPDWEAYDEADKNGSLLLVTLRHQGDMAGYFWGFIGRSMHYKDCLMLKMDIFNVAPAYRGRFGGMILFNKVKKEAKRRGVDVMLVGHKERHAKHAQVLFERLGFTFEERYYYMQLGG